MSTTIIQTGTVTPGHAVIWTTDGVAQDGGAATNGNLTEAGITRNGGIAFGINSAAPPNPYVEYGVGVSSNGTITIYANSFNAAPAATLVFNVNGVNYPFNAGSGDVSGPGSSVPGDIVTFTGTGGNLIADSGIAASSVVTGPSGTAVSEAMAPVLAAATVMIAFDRIAASGGAVGSSLSVDGTVIAAAVFSSTAPQISTSPTGNPTGGSLLATLSAIDVQTTTASTTNREFLVNIGLTSNLGAGVANSNGDKVALYVGAAGTAGTGDLWAINPLLDQAAGSGNYNAQVIEVDMNNFNADRGGTDGAAGLPSKVANGISISGTNDSNNYTNTSGLAIDSFGVTTGHPLWSRGITLSGYYKFCAVADYSISPTAYEMFGGYTWGLNGASGAFSGGMILAPNNTNIVVAETAGGTPAVILKLDASNNLEFAATNVAGVFCGAQFSPQTTNAYSCGNSGNLWTSIWATNGTIQTSDARLKTKNAAQRDFGALIDKIWVGDVTWNDGSQPPGIGVMAQELAEHLPHAVVVPENPDDLWGVNYAALGTLALRGVQDTRAALAETEETVKSLSAALKSAQDQIAVLMAAVSGLAAKS